MLSSSGDFLQHALSILSGEGFDEVYRGESPSVVSAVCHLPTSHGSPASRNPQRFALLDWQQVPSDSLSFKRTNRSTAEKERDTSEDSEAAIDKTPWERNATDSTGDKGKGDHSYAGDQPEGDNPFVAQWVDIWTYESNGNDQVKRRTFREGVHGAQPIDPGCECNRVSLTRQSGAPCD
jgi:hypothetical protein